MADGLAAPGCNGQRQRALGGGRASDCSASSIDDLLTAIEYAHSNDDGRIGAVSPGRGHARDRHSG